MGLRFQMVRELVPESGAVSRMARTPEEDAGTRGVLVVRPVQADDRSGGARGLDAPVALYDGDGRPG
jgi:hypothetical protein